MDWTGGRLELESCGAGGRDEGACAGGDSSESENVPSGKRKIPFAYSTIHDKPKPSVATESFFALGFLRNFFMLRENLA